MESVQRFADFADVSKSKSYRADLISATIQSIANADGKLSLSIIAVLSSIMPTDQSVELLQRVALKEKDPGEWMMNFAKKYPDIFGKLKESLKNVGRKTE